MADPTEVLKLLNEYMDFPFDPDYLSDYFCEGELEELTIVEAVDSVLTQEDVFSSFMAYEETNNPDFL